jgi:hypothetical protein
MGRATLALLLVTVVVGPAATDVYRVQNTNNGGTDSLRWAINQANTHAGRDKIAFSAGLSGQAIRPTTALPAVTDARTVIDGDIDDDGAPDVSLDGRLLSDGTGLEIRADRCTVRGLAIYGFPGSGLLLTGASYGYVVGCHLGVNRAGTAALVNTGGDLRLDRSNNNTIGGAAAADRNIVGGGGLDVVVRTWGISLNESRRNTIIGNYVGLTRDGSAGLGAIGTGIAIFQSHGNVVGGSSPGEGNVVAGLWRGVWVSQSDRNVIAGNVFGLAANGNTLVPFDAECMALDFGSEDNLIGGTSAGDRNVFAGGTIGVAFRYPETVNNTVQGNYFGLNAAGTRQRRLVIGVGLAFGAGKQTIGGNSPAAGNHFCPMHRSESTFGVHLEDVEPGTVIANNRFGVRPDGRDADVMNAGVLVRGATGSERVRITENVFARAGAGLLVSGASARANAFGNVFRNCQAGVGLMTDGRCSLGNLQNAASNDDGGNLFRPTNEWHICNWTTFRVPAEGNDFRTTSRAEINAKILDKRDNAGFGRVDFSPLVGGVVPTGEMASLALTGAAATPTAVGAEISFSLSIAADVTVSVLNIAGRTVATPLRDSSFGTGLQRAPWNGRTTTGTKVPDGRYLIRIVAEDDAGRRATALAPLRLGR